MTSVIKATDTISEKDFKKAIKWLRKNQKPPITYYEFNWKFPFIHKVEFYDARTAALHRIEDLIIMAQAPKRMGETLDNLLRNALKNT